MRQLPFAVLLVLLALLPAQASAFVIQDRSGLEAAANGIVLGPDGNLWASETGAGKVVRMKPDGTILGHLTVGAGPTSMTVGPGGRVWVAVTGADKLVWIDALSASPSTHNVALSTDCGPVGIVADNAGRI